MKLLPLLAMTSLAISAFASEPGKDLGEKGDPGLKQGQNLPSPEQGKPDIKQGKDEPGIEQGKGEPGIEQQGKQPGQNDQGLSQAGRNPRAHRSGRQGDRARYQLSSINYSCAQIQRVVQSQGQAMISWAPGVYYRFVASGTYCAQGQSARPSAIRSADSTSCFAGYICE